MKGLFGTPKKVTPPVVSESPTLPIVDTGAEDAATKQAMRRKGYKKTIITGALSPSSGKKTALG
jgi:hypothetical protein